MSFTTRMRGENGLLETYGAVLIENTLENAFVGHDRRGIYVLAGCQFSL